MRALRRFFATSAKKQKFGTATAQDVIAFKQILGGSNYVLNSLVDADNLDAYQQDWLNKYKGTGQIVLRPRTTEQVSQVLHYCNEKNLAVVPQGGNTGLVGGSVPVFDEIVLQTSLLNKIVSFDEISGTLTCQSGCILESLSNTIAEHGYIMPLDLAAKGSCQIGGNLATAAGGLRFLRYKSLHANVLGLEVVLANGTILSNLKPVRKDNTGYHLNQLFVGSEGTLGVITAVCMQVPIKPRATNVVLLGLKDYSKVQQVYTSAKQHLGEILSAFEFFDVDCLHLVLKHVKHAVNPLQTEYPFYVLLETHGSVAEHDEAKLNAFFEQVIGKEIAVDGTLGFDEAKSKALWILREAISESLKKEGIALYKYDISIPLPVMYKMVEDTRVQLQHYNGKAKVYAFGHLGDDNLHLNITAPKDIGPQVLADLEPWVYEWTAQHNGSISAEHGIGLMKRDYLKYSKTAETIQLMKQMKYLMDPKGILNPYKMFTD